METIDSVVLKKLNFDPFKHTPKKLAPFFLNFISQKYFHVSKVNMQNLHFRLFTFVLFTFVLHCIRLKSSYSIIICFVVLNVRVSVGPIAQKVLNKIGAKTSTKNLQKKFPRSNNFPTHAQIIFPSSSHVLH